MADESNLPKEELMSDASSECKDSGVTKMDIDESSESKDSKFPSEMVKKENSDDKTEVEKLEGVFLNDEGRQKAALIREKLEKMMELSKRPPTKEAHEYKKECLLKLKRFCYIGSFKPVYIYSWRYIDVKQDFLAICHLVLFIRHTEFLPLMRELLHEFPAIRRDEPIFLYAVYMTVSDFDDRIPMRIAFPMLISTDNDLFLFCKYTQLIQKHQKRKWFSRTVRKSIKSWYALQPSEHLRMMWLSHRGLHGFTHKYLIKMCHVTDMDIGSAEVAKTFFKTCTELLQESENPEIKEESGEEEVSANKRKIEESPEAPTSSAKRTKTEVQPEAQSATVQKKKKTATPTSIVSAISKLRTTDEKHLAIKIIRKYKLSYTQVPGHWLRFPVVMEAILPTTPYLEVFKYWRKMTRFHQFSQNAKLLRICKKTLGDLEKIKQCRIFPVHILMAKHYTSKEYESEDSPEDVKDTEQLQYLGKLYKNSFNWHIEKGDLRMHITINLQENYRNKLLANHNKLNFFDAAVGLAFSFFKREKHVDVCSWIDNQRFQVNQIPFENDFSIDQALATCQSVVSKRNEQRLTAPLATSIHLNKVYDVFLCIVPTGGRGHPNKDSEYLHQNLSKYRAKVNRNARLVIIDLLKFNRASMLFSDSKWENILEICGMDNNTVNLIYNFATHRFD